MNFFKTFAFTLAAMCCVAVAAKRDSQSLAMTTPIQEVSFTKVHLNDGFWLPRIETNRTVSIPSAFRECEKNGRFDNFALAAGIIKGEHQGDFSFDDTDPYKIIEGASYSLAVHYDKRLDHYLDSVIGLIAKAQEPDGYLTTCVTNRCTRLAGWWGTRRWEKINSHELYNSGHLYEAAVAHYQATGKRSLLDVAIRNADLVCRTFGAEEGKIHRPSGHPIIEMALCKLYKVTGAKRYLDMARYFVEETGRCTDGHSPSQYSQDHKPILMQDEIVGHAVRAGYLYSGVADVAALTGDKDYFDALCRIWENMASKKLYITGGIGSRAHGEGFGPDYELHNHTAYCETCAAIANVYWNYRMFLATGDSKYVDVYERALYNGVISGVSLSGDRFFYDNPLESMGEHERQKWFGCACCPGNITRFMASVPLYMYATRGNDIFVNLYIQSAADIDTNGGLVNLVQSTGMPWNGGIRLTVNPKKSHEFALRLRVPGWSKGKEVPTNLYSTTSTMPSPEVRVNGTIVSPEETDGYLVISRRWKKGDVVELSLPMDVLRITANDNVDDDRGKVALQRGPVVFCLEGQDQGDGNVFNKAILHSSEITAAYDADMLGGTTVLSGKSLEVEADGGIKEVTFRAIPYSIWNNRGADRMTVWIAQSPAYARQEPKETIASKAMTVTFANPIQNDAIMTDKEESSWAGGVNDQWEPRSSSDTSKPYHYWWLKRGTEETIAYQFDKEYEVSNVQVYWLDFDHYDGNFRVPLWWKLYYKDGNRWREVEDATPFTCHRDRYNSVDFRPVRTSALRIVAKLQEGESGGILEWKVNE